MNMFGSLLFGTAFGLGIALGAAAALAEPVKVERIEVVADYASVENETAAAYWPALAEDLQARLAQALLPQAAEIGTDGAIEVTVTVKELRLDGSGPQEFSSGDNRLSGVVKVRGEDSADTRTFTVTVSSRAVAPPGLPEGWVVLPAAGGDGYAALITAFAGAAAERISRIDA